MTSFQSAKLLIITTRSDHSASLLEQTVNESGLHTTVAYLENDLSEVTKQLSDSKFDYLYIRDPFNTDTFDLEQLRQAIESLFSVTPTSTYIVDNLQSFADIMFEDKWRQYELLGEFMPQTALLQDLGQVGSDDMIVKERISSRSRGIIFTPQEITKPLTEHIIQTTVPIEKEFRVFAVGDKIEPVAAVRTSKTVNTKMKMVDVETISPEIQSFAETIMEKVAFDLTGLDIVQTNDNLYLLEVNRSPQFTTYQKRSGVSLAEQFIELLSKKAG